MYQRLVDRVDRVDLVVLVDPVVRVNLADHVVLVAPVAPVALAALVAHVDLVGHVSRVAPTRLPNADHVTPALQRPGILTVGLAYLVVLKCLVVLVVHIRAVVVDHLLKDNVIVALNDGFKPLAGIGIIKVSFKREFTLISAPYQGGFHLETIHLGIPERQSWPDTNRSIPLFHRKLINSFLLFLQPKACRSRELRCGIMYTTCDCIKRNGLQDKCPRSLCQGRSACMCFPTPNCCPSSFPLRYANMTMGVIKKKNKNNRRAGGGNGNGNGNGGCCSNGNCCSSNGCGCTCNPCGSSSDPAYCGLSNPPCGAPAPIPCSPTPRCCPPLPEGGIPDPRVWNSCNTPQTYPCK